MISLNIIVGLAVSSSTLLPKTFRYSIHLKSLPAYCSGKKRLEYLGVLCLSTAGFIGLCIVLAAIFYYKMQWVGPQLLFGSASIALVLFTLLSAVFLSYPKIMMKFDRLNSHLPNPPKNEVEPVTTRKLFEERPFEPVPSVTEDSTELLLTRNKTNKPS